MEKKKNSNKIPFEYSKITDYIYIGTNQCCISHFIKELVKKGVCADLSLEYSRLDRPWGVKYFLWLPVKNHAAPSQEQLRLGVGFLHEMVANRVKTYVHCKHGHGRAPTVVAAYLVSNGMNLNSALRYIKEKRPSIHLERSQIFAIKKFQRSISKYIICFPSSAIFQRLR